MFIFKGTDVTVTPLNRQSSTQMTRSVNSNRNSYDSRPKSQLIPSTFVNNNNNNSLVYPQFVNSKQSKSSRLGPNTNRLASASQYNESAVNEMVILGEKKPELNIRRGIRGYGFTLRAIQVYYDDTDFYTIQHVVIQVDEQGPAYQAGLRFNDIITHVNDQIVCGKVHHEIVKLILSSVNHELRLRTVNINETKIKNNGRKRSPSKIKLAQPKPQPQTPQQQQQAAPISSNPGPVNLPNMLIAAAVVATASAGVSTQNFLNTNSEPVSAYFDCSNNYDYSSNMYTSENSSPLLYNYANQANSMTNLNTINQQQLQSFDSGFNYNSS